MVDHNVVGSMKYVSKWRHLYITPESWLKYDSMKKIISQAMHMN